MSGAAPLVKVLEATVPAATIAATQDTTVGESPVAGSVTGVSIIPEAALVASATDYRTFTLLNKGADGSAGSDVTVATFATDTPTTDNLVAFDEKALTLSVVADATDVAAGDVLVIAETVAGNGIAHSGYQVKVEISRG